MNGVMWYRLKGYLLDEVRDKEEKMGIGKYSAEEVLRLMDSMEVEEVMNKNE